MLNIEFERGDSMPISCLPVSFYNAVAKNEMTIIDWFRMAKNVVGLDGADIGIMMLKNRVPIYLSKLKSDLEEIGLPLIMVTTYPDYTHPDADQRKKEIIYSKADIAVASQLGAKYVRVVAGQAHPGVSRRDGVKWAVEGMLESQCAARKYGITLVYENHPGTQAWDLSDFSFNPEIFLEICDGLRGSGVKVNFDTGNMTAYGEDPLVILPKVIDIVETLHVTDMVAKGVLKGTTIGTGACPLRDVFAYLKQQGFNGWLCIEEASERGLNGVIDAVNFVREAWYRD